jgi:hypothetical protein
LGQAQVAVVYFEIHMKYKELEIFWEYNQHMPKSITLLTNLFTAKAIYAKNN